MTEFALFPELMPEDQFRAVRLQVNNWGTFNGYYDIPIAEEGFLFVGASGSGKSTLLDAFSQLLIPPRWVDFNAAAHEAGGKSRSDRSLVSYVRGAWSELQTASGVTTQYLRKGTTVSVLALTFANARKRVTLLQLFWLRGVENAVSDVKRRYIVLERDIDIKTELTGFIDGDLDQHSLKTVLGADAKISELFPPYEAAFTGLLGIKSSLALKLLHKTQSAKNLGDLNDFLRSFMLDEPKTYGIATRLVEEFTELDASHRAVVTAMQQIKILNPALTAFDAMQKAEVKKAQLDVLYSHLDAYRESHRETMLMADATLAEGECRRHEDACNAFKTQLANEKSNLADLELRQRQSGGDQIAGWEAEKTRREADRDRAMRERGKVEAATDALGETLPTSAETFAELMDRVSAEVAGAGSAREARMAKIADLSGEVKQTETELKSLIEEIESLESQRSGIPVALLKVRDQIAKAAGIKSSQLVFAGESIEVLPGDVAWRGAIERALRPLALSLLVTPDDFPVVSKVISDNHWGQHVRLCRTGGAWVEDNKPLDADAILKKIRVTDGVHAAWIEATLRRDYNYRCVETAEDWATARQAVTQSGFIKETHTRYDKNDRLDINDARAWVLGMDNRAKLAALRAEEETKRVAIQTYKADLARLDEEDKRANSRLSHCQTIAATTWTDMDPAPILADIARLEKQIQVVREGNEALKALAEAIIDLRGRIGVTEEKLTDAKADLKTAENRLAAIESRLGKLRLQWGDAIEGLTDDARQGIGNFFGADLGSLTMDTLDTITNGIAKRMNDAIGEADKAVLVERQKVENAFATFREKFPAASADLGAGLDFAGSYFQLLETLETDRLPDFEAKFRDLLRQQSMQNLSQLQQYLTEERRDILQRLETVNNSLHVVPFNVSRGGKKTFLRILSQDRVLPAVVEFRQQLRAALEGAWDIKSNEDEAEKRFAILSNLVSHLKDTPENRTYRDTVLDVRRHVEFIGQEVDEEGREVEVYRSGAGKSGGQRQKLTTTCLAAALRYQLCGDSVTVPTYAPVVLDEAFDKADSDFTTLAMNIFRQFGFQMIVATPDKAVTTLEPFIGGACIVHITDRKLSSVLSIPYDGAKQRLVWKAE